MLRREVLQHSSRLHGSVYTYFPFRTRDLDVPYGFLRETDGGMLLNVIWMSGERIAVSGSEAFGRDSIRGQPWEPRSVQVVMPC